MILVRSVTHECCVQVVVNAHILYNLSVASDKEKLSARDFKLQLVTALCEDLTDSLINSCGQAPRPITTTTVTVPKGSQDDDDDSNALEGLDASVWSDAALHYRKKCAASPAEVACVMQLAKEKTVPHLEVPRVKRAQCWSCRCLVPNDAAKEIMKAATASSGKWRVTVGKTAYGCFSCNTALCRQCFFVFHSVRFEPEPLESLEE